MHVSDFAGLVVMERTAIPAAGIQERSRPSSGMPTRSCRQQAG